MITRIDLYNAPYEMNSVDRFYEDVDNKIANYKVGAVNEFSFVISSTTEATLTIEDLSAKRGSYARVESSIFKDKAVSYWFLTEITGIESTEDTRYNAKLDAIATFGEDVFKDLDGKKIRVERLHEDRYTFNSGVFNLNKDNHGLINTDFKVGDTKGVEMVFDGSRDEKDGSEATITIKTQGTYTPYYENLPDLSGIYAPGIGDGIEKKIKNTIVNGNKKYWIFALLQTKGSPVINVNDVTEKKDDKNFSKRAEVIFNDDALRNSVLMPISVIKGEINNIETISKLQEGKVLNIIKVPFDITPKDNEGSQLLFNAGNDRYRQAEIRDGSTFEEPLTNEKNEIIDPNTVLINPFRILSDDEITPGLDYINELYFWKEITSFNPDDILSIPTSKLNSPDIMNFIANTKTIAEMKRIVDVGETERLEIGLLNPEIMPIEMHFHDNVTVLDFYNFANKADKTKILGSYTFNEMGIETTLSISENQFAGWSENTIMSFATDQGATYLARHKYSNDAQKKSIDLSAQQAGLQAHLQKLQGQAQAGNVVSDIMSLGANIAQGSYQAEYAGKIEALQPKIADAKKAQIQGEIDDASATSPTMHTGSGHNLANLNTQEFKFNFNWFMKKPNKFLRDKIVNFLDRHGYSFKDWVVFSTGMVKNRTRFNYIEMANFKDFLGTFDDFDINVLQLLDAEFKKGLRLWHEDIIDYNKPNLEKIIVENI